MTHINEQWPGIFKLKEEMAELSVILNKLCVFPDGNYPDGRKLLKELVDELTDVCITIDYFMVKNNIQLDMTRYQDKMDKFHAWQLSGVITNNNYPETYDRLPKEKWK